ncbi:MAG: serine hydrolase domain-containing protein, partial [Bacteriovoracaceae bacterium]
FPYDYKDNDWQKKADWDLKGYSAAGSIYSNIDDLAKWMNLQFQSHPRDLPRILSPFIINEMHRVQVVESSFDSKRGTGLVWYTKGVDNEKIVGHNGATGGYMAYFGFSKKEKFGVIVLSSNGRADTTGFGEGIIEAVLKELKKERLEDIKVVAEKLLPYLKLEMTEDFQDIFEQGLFDYAGSDEGWSQLLSSINTKHGLPESIQEIIPTANGRGIVKIKTTKGIISYKIVISLDNPEKLSGLLLYNFKSY